MSESIHAPSPEPLFPPLALAVYIACVACAGALANCSIVAALLKSSRNGLFSIIIQLAIADFILGSTTAPELWSYNARTWCFGNEGCVVYRGLSVLASTASSYLVATIALHTLATVNLEVKAIARRIRRNDQDDELRTSRHSLVASSDSSTPPRTMNVDYRLSDNIIPVAQPTAFVWILAISLSVPEFALATAVHMDHGVVLCSLVDSGHRFRMYSMLALFNLFLPAAITTAAGALVIIKLKSKKIQSLINNCESIAALKLSLWLILAYVVFSAPHAILTGYNIYATSIKSNDTALFEMTQQNDTVTSITVALSGVYLGSTLVRPLLCIILLQSVRKVFSFGSVYTETDHV